MDSTANTGTNRHVFVLISASTCRHCIDFKNDVLPVIRPFLESKNLRFVEYNVPQLVLNALSQHHPNSPLHIRTKVRFFPTVMLVSYSTWNRAVAAPSTDIPLLAEVYGGEMSSEGHYVPVAAARMTKDTIESWVETTLAKGTFAAAVASASTAASNNLTVAQTYSSQKLNVPTQETAPSNQPSFCQSSYFRKRS